MAAWAERAKAMKTRPKTAKPTPGPVPLFDEFEDSGNENTVTQMVRDGRGDYIAVVEELENAHNALLEALEEACEELVAYGEMLEGYSGPQVESWKSVMKH